MSDASGLARSCVTRPTYAAIRERLSHDLNSAQAQRSQRRGWNDLTGMPDWAVFELDSMHAAVNRERAAIGSGKIDRELVVRAEQCASGHSDYSSKFLFGCLDLVFVAPPAQDRTL